MLNRGGRVLDGRRRVLDGCRGVLNRSLRRGVRRRLLDHRRTRAAVADRTAGTRALDDRAGVRRHPVAAFDGGFVPSANCRAVLSRDSATTAQRGTFLAQDSAMSPAGRRAGPGAGGLSAAATAGVRPQTRSNRNGGSLRLRRRVTAQHVALAAQHGAPAFAADAQPRPARACSASLTTDSDTPQRA